MSSSNNTAARSSSPPPAYTSSDAFSVTSGKSTKSLLKKVFSRNSSDNSSMTSDRAAKDKASADKETIHAARYTYFATK